MECSSISVCSRCPLCVSPGQICPRWVAPNVLTFVGFLFTVANFVLLAIYDYSYYASSDDPPGDKYPPIPSWVWLACAFNHFMAHTLGRPSCKKFRFEKKKTIN